LFVDKAPAPDEWAIYARGAGAVTGSASDANWNIWTVVFNGASSQFWHNGVSEGAGNPGTDSQDGLHVFCHWNQANFWKGDCVEILLYDANLSDADKNQVGNYLATRYALAYADI
jgi:hypothetical protein